MSGRSGTLPLGDTIPVGHTPETARAAADRLYVQLSGTRFRYASEDDLQVGLGQLLERAGRRYEREVRLSARDRIDFLVEGAIGLEVKCKGKPGDVLRQLSRYALNPRVLALFLITDRYQLTQGIPDVLHGTPLYAVALLGGLR